MVGSFDLIFEIVDIIKGWTKVITDFFMTPIGDNIAEIGELFDKIPLIGGVISAMYNLIGNMIPWTPLQILAGGGLVVILVLTIIKKVVPVA